MKRVVRGQAVGKAKQEQAKQLRKRMTPAEYALWQALRRNQLDGYHFRRQQVIAGFIVDFYCHEARLIVEVDGSIHEQRPGHDAERTRILTHHGFHVLRLSNDEVLHDLDSTLDRIRAIIYSLQ